MDEAAGTADADPALVDEPDAPAGKGANVKVGGEDAEIEFRRCCRRFYSGAVDGHRSCVTVVEAVDRLSEGGGGYAAFLGEQTPAALSALGEAGLPTTPSDAVASVGARVLRLARLVAIRAEERRAAHEAGMAERRKALRALLAEVSEGKGDRGGSFATTRQRARRTRRTVKAFSDAYGGGDCAASHPFLSGMRRVIAIQLSEEGTAVSVLWTLHGAAIAEAAPDRAAGRLAADQYMRDALVALMSFMLWVPPEDDPKGSLIDDMLTFAVDPSLSNRTLAKVIAALPRERDLDGRATGSICVPYPRDNRALVRTNADGDGDEMDFCCGTWMEGLLFRKCVR
jgi:hypothetical protein